MRLPSLTQFQFKGLAAVLMVIDHIGAIFFPDIALFRIVGRLSFPLFAWLLVQGEAHTRHFWRYALRLLVLAFFSQTFYWGAFEIWGWWWELNILFTLLVGLLGLRAARRWPKFALGFWVVAALLAEALRMDYGAYGIGAIAILQAYRFTLPWWSAWGALHLAYALLGGIHQLPALTLPLLLSLSNGSQGRRARWFYGFYPGHLALLWLIHYGLQTRALG